MTRLKYDVVDREIRNALRMGMDDYKKSVDERVTGAKHDRATSAKCKKSDLRKLATFRRI
ncbi:MAG: hypothetical protein NC321_11130 [Clostridium sp.]|nr:hypothetical protein [Clostridium sp.]